MPRSVKEIYLSPIPSRYTTLAKLESEVRIPVDEQIEFLSAATKLASAFTDNSSASPSTSAESSAAFVKGNLGKRQRSVSESDKTVEYRDFNGYRKIAVPPSKLAAQPKGKHAFLAWGGWSNDMRPFIVEAVAMEPSFGGPRVGKSYLMFFARFRPNLGLVYFADQTASAAIDYEIANLLAAQRLQQLRRNTPASLVRPLDFGKGLSFPFIMVRK